jgi:CheY-like chemotaxis protein
VKKLLVVEDDSDIRAATVELLQLEGYKVVAAADGQEGWDAANARDDIALIILDLQMPRLNGIEFMERRADCAKLSRIPVLVTTAFHQGAELRRHPLTSFLRKPYFGTQLLDSIRSTLNVDPV